MCNVSKVLHYYSFHFIAEMCGGAISHIIVLCLLCAASEYKVLGARYDDKFTNQQATRQLNRVEMDQVMQVLNMKSMINDILQTNEKIAERLEKFDHIATKVESLEKDMQQIVKAVKRVDCQKLHQWPDVNASNLINFSGRNFYHADFYVDWYGAHSWCADRGMRLATIKTCGEIKRAKHELNRLEFDAEWFWVSASDIGRASGHFTWPDGAQVDNSTWQRGQPNDFSAGNETCVVLDSNHGALFDEVCDREALILCEVPPALDYCF